MDALLGIVFVAQVPSQPPAVIVQYPPPHLSEQCGEVPNASEKNTGESTGAPRLPTGGSAQDLRLKDADCFGIPAMIFAKLMLPDETLCNRLLYVELDAGQRVLWHDHDVHSHLHFVSFPCNVSEFSRPRVQQQQISSDLFSVEPLERVQRFNVIHILDARYTERQEQQTIMLWQVSAHLSRALVTEEARAAYVSREVRRLTAEKDGEKCLAPHLDSEAAYGLEQLLADMFEGVHSNGCSTLRVNGSVLCQVCAFPKHETLAPPAMGQALVLTCPRDELQQELPLDSADTVRLILEVAMPTISLGELMVQLALPLSTLQRISQHLIYWRKARLVDVYQQHTRVVLGAGVDSRPDALAAQRFHEWQKRLSHKFKPVELTFSEVISAFSRGHPLQNISEQLGAGADFTRILEWLVAEGLVVQLATFVHFLPSRADETRSIRKPTEVNAKIRRDFSQHLSEEELWLLAARSADDHQHLFLCRFVVEFARGHCRTDDSRFAELASRFQQADILIENNSDIFVSYVCRC